MSYSHESYQAHAFIVTDFFVINYCNLPNLARHHPTSNPTNQYNGTSPLTLSTMTTKSSRFYSPLQPPSISMSELVCKTLDHDATDVLIDKWLEHRNDAYWDWFLRVRERRHSALHSLRRGDQLLAWSKGDFVPENIFMRTVDTARLIPLDRTWTTHVYHHRSMQDRKLSMMPVVFTMVRLA